MLGHARRYRQSGLALDPRLTRRASFRRRLDHLLDYAAHRGFNVAPGIWNMDHPDLRYALNELLEVENALALQ
jgi:hypothetical protein